MLIKSVPLFVQSRGAQLVLQHVDWTVSDWGNMLMKSVEICPVDK